MKKNILIYGLQRCGTNFLHQLLLKNFQVRIPNGKIRNQPLHKHFRLYEEKSKVPEYKFSNDLYVNSLQEYTQALDTNKEITGFVVISKNPYSWLLSYKNWGKKCDWPNVPYHYIEEYNLFYEKWLNFYSSNNQQIIFIRYIDLLLNTNKELQRIQKHFDLKNRWINQVIGEVNKLKKVPESKKFTSDRFQYYKNQQYIQEYSNTELEEINEILNPNIISQLGYEMVSKI